MQPANGKVERELINVHIVNGDKEGIRYLKNAEHDLVEGLFYNAKHNGLSSFIYQGVQYDMVRNKDFSFTIRLSEEQRFSPESFA